MSLDLTSVLNVAAMIGLFVVGVYWVVGLRLSWRQTLVRLALSYAAVILASQYADPLARSGLTAGLLDGLTPVQASAVAFGLLLIVALLGLVALYQVMWKPAPAGDTGGGRFFRSLISAMGGVAIAALLVADFFTFAFGRPFNGIASTIDPGWVGTIAALADATLALVRPWLTAGPPLFLGG